MEGHGHIGSAGYGAQDGEFTAESRRDEGEVELQARDSLDGSGVTGEAEVEGQLGQQGKSETASDPSLSVGCSQLPLGSLLLL